MATRVSPRSNASSASSSSSASRIAYRNPSFNRDRDILDPWVSDGRGAYQGKQQHLHRQHNKGQWGHKSNQANRAWGNSDTQIAGKNEERLSWRSQKQAVGNFYMDGGPSNGIQQSYCTYEPSPFPQQGQPAAKTYGNQATPREQSFYSEQRRPAFISEQSPWERHQPNFIKQDHHTSGKIAHSYNPPSSNVNHSQESRGQAIKFHQGFRDDSLNRRQGPGGYSANFNQGSRYTPGNSSRDAGKNSADVTNRGWDAPITRRHEASIDNFPPLTNRVEAGARNVQAVGTSPSATNRFLGGMGASIGSWADECSDDALQTSLQDQVGARGLSIVANSYKADLESPDVSGIRRPNANNSNHRGPVSGVPNNSNHRGPVAGVSNRDTRRQNSRQGSNGALAGEGVQSANRNSWRNQDSIVKQGEASRNTSFPRQHVKHTMSVDPEQRAGAAGDSKRSGASTQNDIYHVGRESREESVRASNDQVFSAQGDAEVPDDVMLPFMMGTCEDMCPLKEREQRERLRDLAVFERVNGNPSKTSKNLAVKKFCRTFSGVKLLSADVRPLRILWSTLQYLLNLLDDSEFSFDVVHNFLFDRTRAIRQELGMQRIANSQAINMYEEIVRFHILSEHELNRRGSGRHVSDSHLNLQQLSKSLLSLFDLYHLNCHEKLANEAEFRAYYVLLNLDSNRHHQADVLSVWFRQCPAVLLNAWELKFARAVLRSYRSGNYRNFFQLAQEATFLQSCLMELHFNEARLKCLAAMNQGGYKLHPIPLADIAKQLLLKEGDLEELCNLCGLSTGMDASRVRCLLVKQSQFSAPKELPSYRCPCIVNKQPSSYYEEVTGTNQRL